MSDKITRAVYKAIAEKVIEQLEWDSTIEKYVLPEGFIFSIDAPIARISAGDLGLSLKPITSNEAPLFNEEGAILVCAPKIFKDDEN
jgi:hypothetical protein